MRVLQAITSGEAGGAQSHVLALCEALRQDVDLAVAIGSGGGVLAERLAALGIPVHALQQTRNSTNPFQLMRAAREMQDLAGRLRPDILHAHSSFAGAATRIAARRCGLPAVYTVHGFGFKREAQSPAREAAWIGERLLARGTDRLICVSEHEAQLARRLPVAAGAVTVIPNGLPDVAFRSDPGREPASVAMVARLAPPKRADLLLEALHLVAAPPPVEVIGDGPLRAELQAQASNFGLTRVRFSGNVADVPRRLAQHRIFVLLSDHEGLPISILEAMRAGMAIIASRLPGAAELVTHGESALLVDNDPHAVAEALEHLLHDPALRAQLGHAARARYEREFGAQTMAMRVLEVYRSLVREPAA
ncbi:glycosyltransferase family 4 protein [Ramlibacter sp. PS4R-6]|uniref:glycosyltransferase family 4 protein n=1 Tax=Ramlibacter sp. PS4R-6 TaxID=3133438 RepID=UPI00309B79F5